MNATKHFLLISVLSLGIVLGASYLTITLHWLLIFHNELHQELGVVFSHGQIGSILSNLLALLLIPTFFTAIVAGVYWCFKKQMLPNVWLYAWAAWLVIGTLLAFQS